MVLPLIDREQERRTLDSLLLAPGARTAVVFGRPRLGKTRLLVDWVGRRGGLYTVADRSTPVVQRRTLALAVDGAIPEFSRVRDACWPDLLGRLVDEARRASWTGPLVLDEVTHLVEASPDLADHLIRWLRSETSRADLTVVLAGSSRTRMRDLVWKDTALSTIADVVIETSPLDPGWIPEAFGSTDAHDLVQCWAAWGGVPGYWEMAVDAGMSTEKRIDRLVLDPHGALHREGEDLLGREHGAVKEVRPVLDALGQGHSRLKGIAAYTGRKATSLARPLGRLRRMGLVRREVPFGMAPSSRQGSLYEIADPFTRLWFRVVAPHRAALATAGNQERTALLARHWPWLLDRAWRDICRMLVPRLHASRHGALGRFGPPARWWSDEFEGWDLVSSSPDGRRLLLCATVRADRPLDRMALEDLAGRVAERPPPALPPRFDDHRGLRVLLVPARTLLAPERIGDVHVVTLDDWPGGLAGMTEPAPTGPPDAEAGATVAGSHAPS